MIQDRLGPEHPFDWPCDGVVATVRRDPRAFAFLRSLVRRGVPVVDLTGDRPAFAVPRVTTDHGAVGRLAAAHFAERGFRNRVFFSVGWGHVQDLRWRGLSEESPAERWSLALERPGAARGGARALARWLEARLAAAPRPGAPAAARDGPPRRRNRPRRGLLLRRLLLHRVPGGDGRHARRLAPRERRRLKRFQIFRSL